MRGPRMTAGRRKDVHRIFTPRCRTHHADQKVDLAPPYPVLTALYESAFGTHTDPPEIDCQTGNCTWPFDALASSLRRLRIATADQEDVFQRKGQRYLSVLVQLYHAFRIGAEAMGLRQTPYWKRPNRLCSDV